MESPPGLLGVRAYARHRTERAARGDPGFEPTSHVAVLKAIDSGRLAGAIVGEGKARRIVAEKADELWLANTDPSQQRDHENGAQPPTFAEVRLELMKWQARREKLAFLRERAKLTDVKGVEKATFEHARRFRNRALELADRVCDRLAAETNPARVRTYLLSELRQVLELDANEASGATPPRAAARPRKKRRSRRRATAKEGGRDEAHASA